MVELVTEITAVTVYPDQARVTRSGELTLKPGVHILQIQELSLRLNPDSVRATARGTAQARLLGVQVQRSFYEEALSEQVHELEDQIEAQEDEQRGLKAKDELVRQNQANLSALAARTETYALALASGEMSVDDQLSIFDSIRARNETLDKELLEIAASQRVIERRLEKSRRELERWRGAPRREAYTAMIEVEVLTPGELTFDLSYIVSRAGWQPMYDLRLLEDAEKPSLEVGYMAQITQRTGEEWKDVVLMLSTARPALTGILPELDPWYIRPGPPPRPASAHKAAAPTSAVVVAMAEPEEESVGAAMEDAVEAEMVMAGVETSGAAVTYHVPMTVTIPADGAPHKASVASIQLEPKLDYVTAPKLVEAVYRRAKVTNDSPYSLLPGQANLFAGDEYLGTTKLEFIAPQGEIELYLGADDRISVERELIRREVDKKLIGNRRRRYYGYEIKLENLLPDEAKVSIHDQLPVSRHEDVKVKLEFADPEPDTLTELKLLTWEFSLAAKGKQEVRFDFSVEYPREMGLVGLP